METWAQDFILRILSFFIWWWSKSLGLHLPSEVHLTFPSVVSQSRVHHLVTLTFCRLWAKAASGYLLLNHVHCDNDEVAPLKSVQCSFPTLKSFLVYYDSIHTPSAATVYQEGMTLACSWGIWDVDTYLKIPGAAEVTWDQLGKGKKMGWCFDWVPPHFGRLFVFLLVCSEEGHWNCLGIIDIII